eukprot:CAMPEP_0174707278 /NCGR_PEP_ID=MMETSP1094-20130205/9838_1 /TAXON_ID=156173 /ORGANISM="Chrysochromulina brevifilum, Strain UTEX LB 985" /LENGTH=125 /DNA_ID=CAMNT_0015905637 /DNA_START=98 /DNA_END=476 /DNA_ORIENTATION=+
MGALLDDGPTVDDSNLVGVANGGQSVRDHHRRAPLPRHDLIERRLYHLLALIIQCRCRLVKQQHRWLAHQSARNRHSLLLAAGQLLTAHTNLCAVPVREVLDDEECALAMRAAASTSASVAPSLP